MADHKKLPSVVTKKTIIEYYRMSIKKYLITKTVLTKLSVISCKNYSQLQNLSSNLFLLCCMFV